MKSAIKQDSHGVPEELGGLWIDGLVNFFMITVEHLLVMSLSGI